jgi:hypothetical protein
MLKTTLLLGLTLCLAGLVLPLATPAVHAGLLAPPIELAPIPLVPPAEVPAPVTIAPLDPAFDSATADYLLTVMSDWPPARAEVPAVPYRDVAESIATVTSDPDDAVLLAAIGYFEGARYARYVDEYRCNDPGWVKSPEGVRLTHWGRCDGGIARSIFQIHPQDDRASLSRGLCSTLAISTRVGAARCALDIAKRSLGATGTLSYYTGEWYGPHPKADERLEFAKRALKRYPAPAPVANKGSGP